MSELNQDIDNLFRELVDPAEMQPSSMVWNSIENNLEKQQHLKLKMRYKKLLVFSVASSTVAVTLLSVLFFNHFKTRDTTTLNKVENTALIATQENTKVTARILVNKLQATAANPNSNTPAIAALSVKKEEQNLVVEEQVSAPIIAVVKTQVPTVKEEEQKEPVVDDLKLESNLPIEQSTLPEIVKPMEETPEPAVLNTNKEETIAETNPIEIVEKSVEEMLPTIVTTPEVPDVKHPEVLPAEVLNSSVKLEENKPEQLEIVKVDSVQTELKPEVSPLGTLKVDTAAAAASLLPIEDYKFFVGLIYSPEKVFTLIDMNSKSSALNENQNYTYSTGIRFGYKLANRWTVFTNIVYSSTSTSFNYNKSTVVEQQEEEHLVPAVYPTQVNLSTSYGEISFPTYYAPNTYQGEDGEDHGRDTLILNVTATQKLKYLSVPLACQYQFGKNRLSGMVSIGFSTNILLSQQADITYNNTGALYSTSISGLRNYNFNGMIAIGVQYRIFNRFSVFAQPTFSQAITSINKNTTYKTYPSSISGSVGLNFHF